MSPPIISRVRQAFQDQLDGALDGINVSGWFNDGQKFPRVQLVEDTGESVEIISDFGVKYATLRYLVVVEESGTDGLSAAQRMDRWVSWDDDNSVYAAINADRTLGLGETVVKDINVAQTWDVNAELWRAELPIVIHVVKS